MIKEQLFNKLKTKGIFWSYSKNLTYEKAGDKLFLEYLLKYGDFDDLILAFKLYNQNYIKTIWEDKLKDDKRFIKLNLMLARVFFGMNVESSYFKEVKSARFEKFRMFASSNQIKRRNKMSINKELEVRSGNKCELCGSSDELSEFQVAPRDDLIVVCSKCREQLEDSDKIDESHWHCLNDSMWSEVDGVKVVAYRVLNALNNQDLLDILYLEDDILEWAKDGIKDSNAQPVRDANGNLLEDGDSVTIIKDLVVKGAGFTAKQGTTVKKIQMVQDDPTHIQGRVNGTKIFILTKFLKKL